MPCTLGTWKTTSHPHGQTGPWDRRPRLPRIRCIKWSANRGGRPARILTPNRARNLLGVWRRGEGGGGVGCLDSNRPPPSCKTHERGCKTPVLHVFLISLLRMVTHGPDGGLEAGGGGARLPRADPHEVHRGHTFAMGELRSMAY